MKNNSLIICLSPIKKYIIYIIFAICILNPISVKNGATGGINLIIATIVPTLLPFIILTNIMLNLNSFDILKKSNHTCILIGFMCGYPLGAKIIIDMLDNNQLDKREAQYLLGFCNNLSPAFIISYLSMYVLKKDAIAFFILFIIILSQLLCAYTIRLIPLFAYDKSDTLIRKATTNKLDLENVLYKSIIQTIKLSSYIIVFSILNSLIIDNIKLPEIISGSLLSILEISSGLNHIEGLGLNMNYKYIISLVATSFGGICGIMQTSSLIKNKLSIHKYIVCKIIASIYTLILSIFSLLFI